MGHTNMTRGWRLCAAAIVAPLALAVQAKELPEGTVISAANLDSIYEDTFEGHKIKDLLTERYEMWVRDFGLTIELEHSQELNVDPAWIEATRANAGQASLDPATNTLQNYTAGAPFPNESVDVGDPQCGWKLAYNYYQANPMTGNSWIATGEVFILDRQRGIIDNFLAHSGKMLWEGRTRGSARLAGSPNDHARYLLVITEPYDIAGLGVFTKQYNDGTLDDGWVYIKNLRRVRRTAGGKAWMDPQPKMDLLNDDNQGSLGFPGWFKNWECKGKRHILGVVSMHDGNYQDKGVASLRRVLNVDEPPHWNPIATKWQPREVFVLEATPPDEHPYGKKVLYMDAKYPFFYTGEFYDKKGDFWRIWLTRYYPYWRGGCEGQPGYGNFNTLAIDFQQERATYILQPFNQLDCMDEKFFQPTVLQKAASGAMQTELDRMRKAYEDRPLLPEHADRAKTFLGQ